MLRVLIVDDELVVRVGIGSMIDWNSHGFEVVGEAGEGEEALSKIRQLAPDIVITDIKMPGMDGIQLIRKIREEHGHIWVLVLSCHNDFEYVKQAMKLGAVDYILKLSMRREELLEVMENIKIQINALKERTSHENSLQRKINHNMDAIKEKFFKKVLSGNYLSAEGLLGEAEELGIRFSKGNYGIAVMQMNNYLNEQKKAKLEPELLRYAVLNIMEEAVPKQLVMEAFAESNDSFVMVFTFEPSVDSFAKVSKDIGDFSRHLKELVLTYLNISVSIGVCDELARDMDQLGEGHKKALKAVEHGFYYKEGRVFYSGGINYSRQVHEYFDGGTQKRIHGSLDAGDIEGAGGCIRELLEKAGSEKDLNPGDVRRMGRMVLSTLGQLSRLHNMTDEEGNPLDFDLKEEDFQRADNIHRLETLVEVCLQEYGDAYNKSLKGAYTEEIRRLLLHIEENYREDMSLEQAAAFLNVGKNYFCSIFKKETGQTFNNYFINVRMEKAKELLRTTPLKNYEVALRVGYDNFNYFSTVFKRVTGMYPNEFRK